MWVDGQKREVPLSCTQGTYERLLGHMKRMCGRRRNSPGDKLWWPGWVWAAASDLWVCFRTGTAGWVGWHCLVLLAPPRRTWIGWGGWGEG